MVAPISPPDSSIGAASPETCTSGIGFLMRCVGERHASGLWASGLDCGTGETLERQFVERITKAAFRVVPRRTPW